LIQKLEAATGTKAPKPLTGLDGREVLFTGCTTKEEMPEVVMSFLTK